MRPPKFKVGDIIRYGEGLTALMRIDEVSFNHGGTNVHRYYGEQFFGDTIDKYEAACDLAGEEDMKLWSKRK